MKKTKTLMETDSGGITKTLAWAVAVSTIGSSFIFGYSIGAVNAPQKLIEKWIFENHRELFGQDLTLTQMNVVFPAAVSLFAIGAMIGALGSGVLADHFGRRGTLHLNNIFAILGSLAMTVAPFLHFYPLFHVGRFVIGINAGVGSSVVPMFITELAPLNWRGALGTLPQLLVTISILISQIFGLPQLFGNERLWPWIFAVTLVPSVFQIIALCSVIESPKFNLAVRGDRLQASEDLYKLRAVPPGHLLVRLELEAITKEAEHYQELPKVRVLDLLRGELLWPTFLACFLQAAQQLTGINAAMFYSTHIFKSAGLTGAWPVYATLAMGTVNVLQTMVSFWLVEHPRFGRRSLLLIGMIGMLFATVSLTVSVHLFVTKYNSTLTEVAPKAAIFFVLLFVISFATGPGSIPFFYVNEVFASNARASASALATGTNWICNFVVGLGFPPLQTAIGEYVFLVFAGCLVVSIAVVLLWLPETKNKTLQEVQTSMESRKPRRRL